jgi:hypothetical protein
MSSKHPKTNLTLGTIIFITCIGLIAGCGDRDNNNSDTGDMNVTPDTQQQEHTRQSDETMNEGEEQTFEVSLDGSNQVPKEVTTDASGNVTVTLRGDSIHVEGEFSDLSSEYLASHIHIGAEGENGDPIQPLDPELGDDKTSGTWDASYQLDESHISALQADSLYINVHSSEYSGGEIRGQLTSSTSTNNM